MKKKIFVIFIIIFILVYSTIMPKIYAEEFDEVIVLEKDFEEGKDNSVEGLQEQEKDIELQITEKEEKLAYIKSVLPEALVEIELLNDEILEYELQIEKILINADSIQKQIEEKEKQIKTIEDKYNEKRETFEKRLLVLYESGESTYLDVLLSTKSLSEFLSTYYIMSEIANSDYELLEDINSEKEILLKAKEELEKQNQEFQSVKNELEKVKITLQNYKTEKDYYVLKLTEEELELQKTIDEYYKSISDIESEILLLTAGNVGSEYVGGAMVWPVPGFTQITSAFGMRVHPITGVFKLHTGTDIGAPTGVNFIAANSGMVIKASRDYAYGNMVIIDHGGGVTTLYAHGSEILVNVGDMVQKGDPVLKVGSTGYSTGSHAHFEVRINAQYVDPMNFVKPI